MQLLPGMDETYPDTFRYLARLIGQEMFDLLDTDPGRMDRRAVYLWNDAAESFLIFTNATFTGTYDPDYEDAVEATLSRSEEGYVLSVWQGENVSTIFFEDLNLEVHLFNYGEVGHFWVEGQEHLRILEYHIAILADKMEYLGDNYVTAVEKKLALLRDFPPLNYCCYPAASSQYVVGNGHPWILDPRAADFCAAIAEKAGDKSLARAIRRYKKHPSKFLAKYVAGLFRKTVHFNTFCLLWDMITKEAAMYPERQYTGDLQKRKEQLVKVCEKWKTELYSVAENGKLRRHCGQGSEIWSVIIREEPFLLAEDDTELSYRILKCINRHGRIVTTVGGIKTWQ